MYQIRIYTLATPAAADEYFTIHWKRHISSLEKFNIHTESVFKETGTDGQTRVFAVCRFDEGTDMNAVNEAYMKSPEFREDMQGFQMSNIINVEGMPAVKADFL